MLLALASLNRNIHLFFLTYTRVVFGSLSPCSCNPIAINVTTSDPYINDAVARDVCVCPVQGFWFLTTSALPEEILKYFAISLFIFISFPNFFYVDTIDKKSINKGIKWIISNIYPVK